MESHFATEAVAQLRRRSLRATAVNLIGPLTMLAGVAWAFLQPYRLTILHPYGQGFWWLLSEPPLCSKTWKRQRMLPRAEFVHWWFATGFLIIGLLLLAEAVVGEAAWRRRPWRPYLWPSFAFLMGVLMWPVMVFFTSSTIHMLAHGSWAQVMMLAGAAELGLARGKLHSPYWRLCTALAFLASGAALLIHEQNGWFYARSAFLHHLIGWTVVTGAVFPLLRSF